MLHFILGPSGSGKSYQMLAELRTRAERGERSILIVPEQFTSSTEGVLYRTLGDSLSAYVESYSFTSLAEALLRRYGGAAVETLSEAGRALLVRRAAEPLEVPMEVRSIRFTAQAGEERLTCDVPWSTEALGNILKNCMEHAASWVQVTARETAIFTEITVQDDGPGFDPEELPGKPGLYGYGDPIELPCPIELISMGGIICTEQDGKISRQVLAQQNGTVQAENVLTGGARFILRWYKGTI